MSASGGGLSPSDIDRDTNQIVYENLTRRDVRSLIFQLLYAAEAFDYQESIVALLDNFNRGFNMSIPVTSDVVTSAVAVVEHRDELDMLLRPLLLNWRLERVGVCTKLILRFAVWELRQKETPANIVINEAIELSKCFAEKDAYKFINGILDEAVRTIPALQGAPSQELPDDSTLDV